MIILPVAASPFLFSWLATFHLKGHPGETPVLQRASSFDFHLSQSSCPPLVFPCAFQVRPLLPSSASLHGRCRKGGWSRSFGLSLVPLHPSGHLVELDGLVGDVTSEEQVVSGLHHPCKPHEEHAVHAHGCSHIPRTSRTSCQPGCVRTAVAVAPTSSWVPSLACVRLVRSLCFPSRPSPLLLGGCVSRAIRASASPAVMFGEIISAGFLVSASPASTKPQLATGPQKCVVLGPVSEARNARARAPSPCFAALLAIAQSEDVCHTLVGQQLHPPPSESNQKGGERDTPSTWAGIPRRLRSVVENLPRARGCGGGGGSPSHEVVVRGARQRGMVLVRRCSLRASCRLGRSSAYAGWHLRTRSMHLCNIAPTRQRARPSVPSRQRYNLLYPHRRGWSSFFLTHSLDRPRCTSSYYRPIQVSRSNARTSQGWVLVVFHHDQCPFSRSRLPFGWEEMV